MPENPLRAPFRRVSVAPARPRALRVDTQGASRGVCLLKVLVDVNGTNKSGSVGHSGAAQQKKTNAQPYPASTCLADSDGPVSGSNAIPGRTATGEVAAKSWSAG